MKGATTVTGVAAVAVRSRVSASAVARLTGEPDMSEDYFPSRLVGRAPPWPTLRIATHLAHRIAE